MTRPLPFPTPMALIGAGRVGTAAAVLLQRAGCIVTGVSSRAASSAQDAAQRLAADVFDHAEGIPSETRLVLIGAGDGAIADVASTVAPHVTSDHIVWHCAGSLGVEALAAVTASGADAVALHPVQACPDVDSAIARLPGSAWGVTCSSDRARDWTGRAVKAIDGVPVDVAEEARPIWHAASVTTSNGTAALLSIAESMLDTIGIVDPASVLAPLAIGTVVNARDGGGGGRTLTGPVIRGETDTVARHLAALGRTSPPSAELYREVASLIVSAAHRAGRIDDDTADAMTGLLRR